MLFSALNTVIYAIPAHWVWSSEGWLNTRRVIDSLGAGPVHLVGGMTGLVAALLLRPRAGWYKDENLLDEKRKWRVREKPRMGSPINRGDLV